MTDTMPTSLPVANNKESRNIIAAIHGEQLVEEKYKVKK